MSVSLNQLSGFTPLNLSVARGAHHAHRAPTAVDSDPSASGDAVSVNPAGTSATLQAAAGGVQDALTATQTSDAYLGQIAGQLTGLGHLATLARNGPNSAADLAQYQQEFSALQDQIRSAIGGSASEIGGAAVDSPVGSFQGSALFGADTPSGNAAFGQVDLRQGSMLQLISQDDSGAYGLNVTSPNAPSVISGAAQQVVSGRAALQSTQTQLGRAAAEVQVGQQNQNSVISPLADAAAAGQSVQYIRFSILGDLATALKAQGGQKPSTVLNLVGS